MAKTSFRSGLVSPPPGQRGLARTSLVAGIVVVVIVLAGGMLALRGQSNDQNDKIDLYTVARQSFDVTATASGELRAKKQTVLRSELEQDATIVEIVEEGSRVKSGDVLVRLNSDDIQSELDDETLQLESARAEVVAAESALAIQKTENESGLRKANVDVLLAEIELQKFEQGDVVEKRLELNLAVEKGNRETKRLGDKVERSRMLFDKDFLSKDELEQDEIEFIEAQAQLRKAEVAKSAYEEYTYDKERKKLESDLDQAKAELDKTQRKAESELVSKEADLINKRRRFELHQDKVKKFEDQLAKSVIKAPTDGLVVYATSLEQFMWMNNQEPLNVGTQIRPNQEIIMLPDTSEMVAVVKVAENLVGRIQQGQTALVMIDAAQGRKYTGTVETIGIMAQSGGWRDPNVREYEVRVSLDLGEEKHGLKPSMRCEGRLTLSNVSDVIAVPLPAVFTEGANHFVYKSAGDRYEQTPVRIGKRSDTLAEIVTGLTGGERVLLREPPTARIVKAKFEESPDGPGTPGGRGGPGAHAKGPRPGAKGPAKDAAANGAAPAMPGDHAAASNGTEVGKDHKPVAEGDDAQGEEEGVDEVEPEEGETSPEPTSD